MRFFLFCVACFIGFVQAQEVVHDIEGNTYGTVILGSQVWLTSNLKTKHFSNGDSIPTTVPATLVITSEYEPIYQWAYNGDENYVTDYGRLYTWYTVVDERNICPTGWHVPSDEEFKILENFLGGSEIAGGKLKEAGEAHWFPPNTGATNETGFNALPSGNRNLLGYFNDMGIWSDWWTTTETETGGAWDRDVDCNSAATSRHDDPKLFCFAVRCISDKPAVYEMNFLQPYPVPSDGIFNVDCKNIYGIEIELFNMTGQVVYRQALVTGVNAIDLRSFENGDYIFKCSNGVIQEQYIIVKI